MKTPLLALLLLITTLAGCTEPDEDTGNGTSTDLPLFDGDAAFAFVEDIVYLEDGALRPRHPQSAGHDDTVAWLVEQMTVPGWQVRLDTFTGEDYLELDHGAVASYGEGSRYCQDDDFDELPDLNFANLYATMQGSGDGHVVLAAHWDAKEDAHDVDGPVPAANDGASGMGVLLQLQQRLGAMTIDLPFDLTIAFFDGEDGFEDCHPLAGSLWAARNGSLGDISQLILLDMVGDADARFILESHSTASDPELMEAIWSHAANTSLANNFVAARHSMQDDHVPFIDEGVPAIDIIDAGRSGYFPPYWHTAEDTPDKLSPEMLGRVGGLVLWLLTDQEAQAFLTD